MSRLTRKAIMEAFMELLQRKSLDKITVKDIIESAEVNRNTFYYHFQDIYDLLEQFFQNESDKFRSEAPSDNTFYEEYVRLADAVDSYRDAIIHIYNSKSRDVLTRYFEDAIRYFVFRFVEKAAEGTDLSENGADYIAHFYTYAIIGATTRWIENGMPDYRNSIMKTVSASFEATIDAMIQSYIGGHPEECRKNRI